MDGQHRSFKAEPADDHPIADSGRAAGRRLGLTRDWFDEAFGDSVNGRSGFHPHSPGLAGRHHVPCRLAGDAIGLGLEIGNHLVDRPARLPHFGLQLFAQPLPECLFPLLQRIFPVAEPRVGRLERFTLARGEPVLVLERAHVAVDLRQVFRQLRFAHADVLARRGDDRRPQSQTRRDLERNAAAGRPVNELIGGSKCLGIEAERRSN